MTDEEFARLVRDLAQIAEAIKHQIMCAKTAASESERDQHLNLIVDIANQLFQLTEVSPPPKS